LANPSALPLKEIEENDTLLECIRRSCEQTTQGFARLVYELRLPHGIYQVPERFGTNLVQVPISYNSVSPLGVRSHVARVIQMTAGQCITEESCPQMPTERHHFPER
jgi:hypothetical protein